jgi:hypothetical protein
LAWWFLKKLNRWFHLLWCWYYAAFGGNGHVQGGADIHLAGFLYFFGPRELITHQGRVAVAFEVFASFYDDV